MATECQISPEGSITIEGETIGADELSAAFSRPWWDPPILRGRWKLGRVSATVRGGRPVDGTVELIEVAADAD
jgi:hypothetical protein